MQKDAVDRVVGNRVRERRNALGLSQTELADAVGVSFQQIQKYEKGTNRIASSRLQEIAQFLGVAPAYFFDSLPTSQPKQDPSQLKLERFVSSAEGVELARAFGRVRNAKTRRKIVALVQIIVGAE